jgi:hypothetical protein
LGWLPGAVSYVSILVPYFGPAPWRRFILVQYLFHALGRQPGAISYVFDTCSILWDGAMVQFHMFNTFSILWAGALVQFHICSIFCPYFAGALMLFHMCSILFRTFWPGPWRSFIFFRYFFHTLGRGHNAVSYFPYIFHTLGWCPGAVSYFFDICSILWAGAIMLFLSRKTLYRVFSIFHS